MKNSLAGWDRVINGDAKDKQNVPATHEIIKVASKKRADFIVRLLSNQSRPNALIVQPASHEYVVTWTSDPQHPSKYSEEKAVFGLQCAARGIALTLDNIETLLT